MESLRFRKVPARDDPAERGHLYVAEQDGYVDFLFQYDPDQSWHGQGFDGRQFRLHLDDGTVETLIGPWSSSATTAALWQELGHRFPAVLDQDSHRQRRSPQQPEQRLMAGTQASGAAIGWPAKEAASDPEHVAARWEQDPEDQIATGVVLEVLGLAGAEGIDPPPGPALDDLDIA